MLLFLALANTPAKSQCGTPIATSTSLQTLITQQILLPFAQAATTPQNIVFTANSAIQNNAAASYPFAPGSTIKFQQGVSLNLIGNFNFSGVSFLSCNPQQTWNGLTCDNGVYGFNVVDISGVGANTALRCTNGTFTLDKLNVTATGNSTISCSIEGSTFALTQSLLRSDFIGLMLTNANLIGAGFSDNHIVAGRVSGLTGNNGMIITDCNAMTITNSYIWHGFARTMSVENSNIDVTGLVSFSIDTVGGSGIAISNCANKFVSVRNSSFVNQAAGIFCGGGSPSILTIHNIDAKNLLRSGVLLELSGNSNVSITNSRFSKYNENGIIITGSGSILNGSLKILANTITDNRDISDAFSQRKGIRIVGVDFFTSPILQHNTIYCDPKSITVSQSFDPVFRGIEITNSIGLTPILESNKVYNYFKWDDTSVNPPLRNQFQGISIFNVGKQTLTANQVSATVGLNSHNFIGLSLAEGPSSVWCGNSTDGTDEGFNFGSGSDGSKFRANLLLNHNSGLHILSGGIFGQQSAALNQWPVTTVTPALEGENESSASANRIFVNPTANPGLYIPNPVGGSGANGWIFQLPGLKYAEFPQCAFLNPGGNEGAAAKLSITENESEAIRNIQDFTDVMPITKSELEFSALVKMVADPSLIQTNAEFDAFWQNAANRIPVAELYNGFTNLANLNEEFRITLWQLLNNVQSTQDQDAMQALNDFLALKQNDIQNGANQLLDHYSALSITAPEDVLLHRAILAALKLLVVQGDDNAEKTLSEITQYCRAEYGLGVLVAQSALGTEATGNQCTESRSKQTKTINQLDVLVQPNPASNFIHVRIPLADTEWQVNIRDINGKLLKTQAVGSTDNVQVALDGLHSGLYFVEVLLPNGTMTSKLVISK
jgi:Secretion system C-terminal sorting domain